MSVVQALDHTSSKNPQIQKLLLKHHNISELKTITYCFDQNAKESMNSEETIFKIPYVK